MLKARTNHASSALNGEIYVIGGKAPLSIAPGCLLLLRPPLHLSILQQWLPTPMPSLGTREPPCWAQGQQRHCPRSCLQELTVWGKQDPR